MKTTSLGFMVSAAALVCAACGTAAATTELVSARNAYAQARNSEAAELNPAGVHEAYKALQLAEAAHQDDAGSAKEKNTAYIATRKAERAVAQASGQLAVSEQQRAKQGYQQALEHRAADVAAQSSQYQEQLGQTQRVLQQNTAELQQREQQLQQREQELQRSQQAAAAAQEQLRKSESMREEAGRMIISLSGGVMFQTGGSELSVSARQRLDTVANALGAYPDRDIVVEGHTDSQGNDEANRELSQRRASAVRAYLVSRGVPDARIRAVGRGESEPVATNDTAEGRASNRRVEVVVEPQRAAPESPTTGRIAPRNGRDARTPDAPASPDAPTGADPSSGTPAQPAPGVTPVR